MAFFSGRQRLSVRILMCWPYMVVELASRLSGLRPSPGWGHGVVFLGKIVQSHIVSLCLSPPSCMVEYRLIHCFGQPCDGLASHPGGSRNTPSHFTFLKPALSFCLIGHLARVYTLPYVVKFRVLLVLLSISYPRTYTNLSAFKLYVLRNTYN